MPEVKGDFTMIYGYSRVSTKGQAKDGNSLESQEKALKEAGATKIFTDAFTGTKTVGPITEIRAGDTLVVTKLDRFARSMSQGSELVSELIDKGVRVYILNIGILDNTPASKLIRNVFFAFEEFERDMIVERTSEGKAIAKQNPDFKEGRPKKYSKKQVEHAIGLLDNHSYKQVDDLTGISKSTLIRAKKLKKGLEKLEHMC